MYNLFRNPSLPVSTFKKRSVTDMSTTMRLIIQNPEKAFVIPSMYFGPLILIPASLDAEFRSALDSQLSASVVQFKLIQPWHTLPDPTWGIKPTAPYRVGFNRVLNRSIGAEVSTTAAELAQLCDDVFKVSGSASAKTSSAESSGEWNEIKAHESMMMVATMNVSRLYVGNGLAQNKHYVKLLLSLLQAILTCVWLVNLFPDVTKPYVFASHDQRRAHVANLLCEDSSDRLYAFRYHYEKESSKMAT